MGYVRFSLALVVLAAHAGFGFRTIGSLCSVEAFFVLSGMYMAAVWASKYGKLDRGARFFYLNRGLRLWPTYVAMLLLTAAAYVLLGRPEAGDNQVFDIFRDLEQGLNPRNIAAVLLTFVLFGQDVASVNENFHYLLSVRQSWSIATELLFYATVPLVFRKLDPRYLVAAAAGLFGFKLLALHAWGFRVAYFLPVGNFSYFLLGGALYWLSTQPLVKDIKSRFPGSSAWFAALAVGAIFLLGESSLERGGLVKHLTFLFIFCSLVVLAFHTKPAKVDAVLGNISYSLYLNHFLIISILGLLGYSGYPLLALTFVASLLLSYATERYLQRPIDDWRSAATTRARVPAVARSAG